MVTTVFLVFDVIALLNDTHICPISQKLLKLHPHRLQLNHDTQPAHTCTSWAKSFPQLSREVPFFLDVDMFYATGYKLDR